jgi:UPF0042 nucleotide-binding protein
MTNETSNAKHKTDELSKRQIVFVSGLSGAGMSSALKNLEDFGFEVFDNMPLFLIDQLIETKSSKSKKPLAFGLDSRTRNFSPTDVLNKKLELENNLDYDVSLCYMSCDESVIHNRYSLTRRPHPLAQEQSIHDGIAIEKTWLTPLRENADLTIDTTDMGVHDLKRLLSSRYHREGRKGKIFVTTMSFGFKNSSPREADMILDVRFLDNPHWDRNLRPLTGQDENVQNFIKKDKTLAPFLEQTKGLLDLILPSYEVEGKSYFTLAIGCTGGKHRSVFVTERIYDYLNGQEYPISLRHRDIQI